MDVTGKQDGTECVTSILFDRVWECLCDALGCAAAAVLLRRSLRRARARCPELGAVTIERAGARIHCRVPDAWRSPSAAPLPAFRAWVEALVPYLVELTGAVVIRRLDAIPELARCHVIPSAFSPRKDRA